MPLKNVRVINKGPTKFTHPVIDEDGETITHTLLPHGDAVVPKFIADLWMAYEVFGKKNVVAFTDKEAEAVAASQAGDLKAKDAALEEKDARITNLEKLLEEARVAAAGGKTPVPAEVITAPSQPAPAAKAPVPTKPAPAAK